MRNVNVISIDPARESRAALHPEAYKEFAKKYYEGLRSKPADKETKPHARNFINSVFGINDRMSKGGSSKLLLLRIVIGAVIIAYAGYSAESSMSSPLLWVELILGASLITGFFSRIISVIAFIYLGITLGSDYAAQGVIDLPLLLPLLTAVVFMVTGPGIFSFDQLFRKSLFKITKRREHNRAIKLANNRLSYKAYQYM